MHIDFYFFLFSIGACVVLGSESPSCADICATRFADDTKGNSSCAEGCRLSLLLQFAAGRGSRLQSGVAARCDQSCAKAFSSDSPAKNACSVGCAAQAPVDGRNIEISIDSSDATFGVAKKIMNDMFGDMRKSFRFPGFASDDSLENDDDESTGSWMDDPFADMRKEMQRMQELTDRLFRHHFGNLDRPRFFTGSSDRPSGHETSRGESAVGNVDANGRELIQVVPVETANEQDEEHVHAIAPSTTWMDRLAARARHLSALSQWLVCIALLLCLLSLLAICLALVRQSRHLTRRSPYTKTGEIYQPVEIGIASAKKIPDEDESPRIHGSPPPAYDELSLRSQK